MNRKSTSYLTSLDPHSVSDMQTLQLIRRTVSMSNKRNTSDKKRVVIRGREAIVPQTVKNYWTGKVGTRSYDFAGNIVGGLSNARRIDVYIYDRRD